MGRGTSESLILALDFDGTITLDSNYKSNHQYLQLRPGMDALIQWLYSKGTSILLWTCRTPPILQPALDFLDNIGILSCFEAINGPSKHMKFSTSAKVYADLYVDDLALGFNPDNPVSLPFQIVHHLERDLFLQKKCTIDGVPDVIGSWVDYYRNYVSWFVPRSN